MQVLTFQAWASQLKATTEPSGSDWCGIAIGPGSDEGRVLVDGHLLQSGRVLPLRSKRYAIQGVRPAGITALAPIAQLQVILFADPAAMACEVARPNLAYYTRAFQATAGKLLAASAPYVGRRQALFTIASSNLVGAFAYEVVGVRYQYSRRDVVRVALHTEPAATMTAEGTYAFYLGGTDDAEDWDVLELYITGGGTSSMGVFAKYDTDIETIGEIGAR